MIEQARKILPKWFTITPLRGYMGRWKALRLPRHSLPIILMQLFPYSKYELQPSYKLPKTWTLISTITKLAHQNSRSNDFEKMFSSFHSYRHILLHQSIFNNLNNSIQQHPLFLWHKKLHSSVFQSNPNIGIVIKVLSCMLQVKDENHTALLRDDSKIK